MVPVENLWAFVAASVVLIVIPGPSVLFVIGRSLALGRLGGLLSVVGNALGMVPLVAAVALGVGALVAQSVVIFTHHQVRGRALPGLPRHPGDPPSRGCRGGRERRGGHPLALAAARRGLHRRRDQPQDDRLLRRGAPPVRRLHRRLDPAAALRARRRVHSARAHLRLRLGPGRERGPRPGSRAPRSGRRTSPRPAA